MFFATRFTQCFDLKISAENFCVSHNEHEQYCIYFLFFFKNLFFAQNYDTKKRYD